MTILSRTIDHYKQALRSLNDLVKRSIVQNHIILTPRYFLLTLNEQVIDLFYNKRFIYSKFFFASAQLLVIFLPGTFFFYSYIRCFVLLQRYVINSLLIHLLSIFSEIQQKSSRRNKPFVIAIPLTDENSGWYLISGVSYLYYGFLLILISTELAFLIAEKKFELNAK